MKELSVVLLLFALAFAKHEQYKGWKSYSISTPTNEAQSTFISLAQSYQVGILGYPLLQRDGLVIVGPEHQKGFLADLKKNNIKYNLHRNDLKAAFDFDDLMVEEQKNATRNRAGGGIMPYDNYQELEVIYAYLDDVAARNLDVATLVTPAYSFEGRPIKYLKISTTNFLDHSKPVIFINSAMHAREWITPPTSTWVIKKLVEDRDEPHLLRRFDWIILPVANPDGYKFSFTRDRMWRMTRSTDQHIKSRLCPGVDMNRNFEFAWNTKAIDRSPCSTSYIYPGARPFSEIETRVIRNITLEHLHRPAFHIYVHSAGSMILYPWGHDGSLSNYDFELQSVGYATAQTIDSLSLPHFPDYVVGNSFRITKLAVGGAADDYAHSIGVRLAYTFELPGFGQGHHRFHLDPKYIEQVSRETWAGIAAGARRALELFPTITTKTGTKKHNVFNDLLIKFLNMMSYIFLENHD